MHSLANFPFCLPFQEDGVPECFHDEIVSGGWNIWTQRAICPPNFKATVQRYAPMELNSIGNDPDYSHPKSHPNVTCTAVRFNNYIDEF